MINFKTIFSRIMSIRTVQRQSIVTFIWQVALTLIGFLSTMYFAHAEGASVLAPISCLRPITVSLVWLLMVAWAGLLLNVSVRGRSLSLIHISEPTRLRRISY